MASSRQPVCAECNHPRSFHRGGSGACKALGCKACSGYVPRISPPEQDDAEH